LTALFLFSGNRTTLHVRMEVYKSKEKEFSN